MNNIIYNFPNEDTIYACFKGCLYKFRKNTNLKTLQVFLSPSLMIKMDVVFDNKGRVIKARSPRHIEYVNKLLADCPYDQVDRLFHDFTLTPTNEIRMYLNTVNHVLGRYQIYESFVNSN